MKRFIWNIWTTLKLPALSVMTTILYVIVLLNMFALPAHAEIQAPSIRISAFTNVVASYSNSEEEYLEGIDEDGDWSDSNLAVNLNTSFGHWDFAAQIEGELDNDGIIADWYLATYHFSNSTSFSAGKLKYPNNLVSEYLDLGHAFPWIRAPQEVYIEENEAHAHLTIEYFKGATIRHSFEAGIFEVGTQLYTGALEEKETGEQTNIDQMIGFVLLLESEHVDIKFGYNTSDFRSFEFGEEEEEEEEEEEGEIHFTGEKLDVISLGIHIDWNNFIAYSEWNKSTLEGYDELDTTGWYTTIGYRFGKFLPHYTYAKAKQDAFGTHSSSTIGIRYDLTSNSALKFEFQHIDPAEDGGYLFEEGVDDNVNVYSVALHYVF